MGFKVRTLERVAIHGHRGSRGTCPENTPASFEEALKAGADFFELDTHLSADNIPVVYHDAALSGRLCTDENGKKLRREIPVHKLSAEEITHYRVGAVLDPHFPDQKQVNEVGIPLLEEVLTWLAEHKKKIGVNIELKITPETDCELFARVVIELVRKYSLRDRAVLQSFDLGAISAITRQDSKATVSCLFDSSCDFSGMAKRVRSKIVGPSFDLLNPQIVSDCHEEGIEVLPWTVNQEEDWDRILKFGVDGIITDYPKKLRTYLEQKHG